MPYEIIISPDLEQKLKKIDKTHRERIFQYARKIQELGLSCLKILVSHGEFVLADARPKNPPFRLYVIVNKTQNTVLLLDWENKNKQGRTIGYWSGMMTDEKLSELFKKPTGQ